MRIALLGMECGSTAAVLDELLAAGITPGVLLLAGSPPELADFDGATARLARGAGIPVANVSAAGAPFRQLVERTRPDLVVAACFPRKLPPSLLALPPLGCLNLHPSLLPLGRGPEPVFWTLRRGERATGVTLHRMNDRFDAGPLLAQTTLPIDGAPRAPDLEVHLMRAGARSLIDLLPALVTGNAPATAQDEARATYAPIPAAADWLLPTNLPAAWAWRFARGVAPLGGPLAVMVGSPPRLIPVSDAVDHDPADTAPDALAHEPGGVIRVRFRPGWARFQT